MSLESAGQTPHPAAGTGQGPASLDQRKRNLANAIQGEVAAGWRIESQTDDMAVLVKGRPISHGLHLFLTIITAGLWGVAWIVLAVVNKRQVRMLRVDEYGAVLRN